MAESGKARQWAKRIAAFEGSGLSRRAWCLKQGLNPNTLDYWRSRLRGAHPATGARAKALVPIVVTGSGAAAPGIQIAQVGGTQVRAPCGVDAAWLSALVRGLTGC